MTDWLNQCHFGDCLETLRRMPDGITQTCVTSPPYFGLRNYDGGAAEIGREKTPTEFVAALVAVFSEVKRVLRDDGTCWVNLGDTYRDKCLQMIPARFAIAMMDGGWILRNEIIWAKKNLTPQSVTDRCTHAHEQFFLFAKQASYYFDAGAIKEPAVWDVDGTGTDARKERATESQKSAPTAEKTGMRQSKKRGEFAGKHADRPGQEAFRAVVGMRNKRSVWSVATTPYSGAHFATFPPALIEPCILAGAPVGGVVLDPFFGSGTTGQVAQALGRHYIGCELNPAYKSLQDERLCQPSFDFLEAV
jgi:site-specific DNA-methyltransferase (adenine-specific)